MKKVKAETGVGLDWVVNGKLFDLDYADDIILIYNGPEKIQRVLNCLVNEGLKVGLVINSRETEIINMNIENAHNCLMEGSVIKEVDRFKYLGPYLTKDCSLKLEFEERLRHAHQAMGMLKIF